MNNPETMNHTMVQILLMETRPALATLYRELVMARMHTMTAWQNLQIMMRDTENALARHSTLLYGRCIAEGGARFERCYATFDALARVFQESAQEAGIERETAQDYVRLAAEAY